MQSLTNAVRDVTKLRADVEIVSVGDLPNDGKVIDDMRTYT
jgi:phenylacetate-CoA ligase